MEKLPKARMGSSAQEMSQLAQGPEEKYGRKADPETGMGTKGAPSRMLTAVFTLSLTVNHTHLLFLPRTGKQTKALGG